MERLLSDGAEGHFLRSNVVEEPDAAPWPFHTVCDPHGHAHPRYDVLNELLFLCGCTEQMNV